MDEQTRAHVNQLASNPHLLEQLLLQMTVPDTAQIKAAEEMLKHFTKLPESVPPLINQMQSSQQEQARQLAAVLLKRKMMAHWSKFNETQQAGVKGVVLQAVQSDPSRLVRHAIASLIAKMSKAVFSKETGWPELLELVGQCARQQQSEDHRELAFIILNELTETVGEVLKSQFSELQGLFLGALKDPCPKVQVSALRASSALLGYLSLDKEGMQFQAIIPPTLEVAKACVARGDEESVANVLEVFADLCQSPLPLVHPYLGELVSWMLDLFTNPQLEMNTKDCASLALSTLADCKPKLLGKSENVPAIIQTMLELIASHEGSAANALFNYSALDDDDDDDDGDDGPNPQSIAQATLDSLALSLPVKYTFTPLMELCGPCLQHPNAHTRKAAVAAMGVMAEGCQEPIRQRLGEILPMILQAAMDQDHLVRECACFCLGQLSEHCQPEVLDFHEQILPVIFNLLDDSTDNVKGVSCYVLENFCVALEPEMVRPFLDPLMTRLVQMLHTRKKAVQEMSVAAIAATAVAAEMSFLPYLQATANMMGEMMNISDESMLSLRGRALECMGHMAIAVEKEHFKPYVQACMQSAVDAFKMEEALELHEYAYTFFANLAKVLGNDMAPYIPELVPAVLQEIRSSEDEEVLAQLLARQREEDDDEDDDDDEGLMRGFGDIRTGAMDKKKAALVALGALAEGCPVALAPHLGPAMDTLNSQINYWHSDMRCGVCECLRAMVWVGAAAAVPQGTTVVAAVISWTKGEATQLPSPLGPLVVGVVKILLTYMCQDDDPPVVAAACEALSGVLEQVGMVAIEPVMKEVMEATNNLLTEQAPCFANMLGEEEEEEGEGEDEDEDTREDATVQSAACEMISTFAKVIGPKFAQCLDVFLPAILKYTKGSRPATDRIMAMGTLAEVMHYIDGEAAKYVPQLVPLLKRSLADGNSAVKRNAAFCVGTLAESAKEAAVPHYMELLQALAPLFSMQVKGQAAGVVDNAAAAVARLITTSAANVPMAQVLPVFLNALPLKSDQNENAPVYSALLYLLGGKHPDALQHLEPILSVFAQALSPTSKVQDEVQEQIVTGLQEMTAAAPEVGEELNKAMQRLPREAGELLVARLSNSNKTPASPS